MVATNISGLFVTTAEELVIEMTKKSWPVEVVIPCGIKKDGVKCDSLNFTAIPSRGDKAPVYKCDKCKFIKYRVVIIQRSDKK